MITIFFAPDLPKVDIINYKENLKDLILKIKEYSKVPILCNLQPISNAGFYSTYKEIADYIKDPAIDPFGWQRKYSDACQQVATSLGIKFIDIRTPLESSFNNIWCPDGMHPNDEGHAIIAQVIIRSLGEIRVI
ncbi:MAG: GDSL-type esterase/lipase family protein [Candidatus Omnitrophota bacterium]